MAEEYGKVKKSTMTAIADAIRAKKDTTAIFTPAQMAVEIESLEMVSELPNAEDASFGTAEGEKENGLTHNGFDGHVGSTHQCGWEFEVQESFAVLGFRWAGCAYVSNGTKATLALWDTEKQTQIATLNATGGEHQVWKEYLLESPINLTAGKTYAVTQHNGGYNILKNVTYNQKISYKRSVFAASGYPVNTSNSYVSVDIIIGKAITETVITEYKIRLGTLTDIADEVKRITGAVGTLNTNQIQSGLESVVLQEKTATPTAETQTITPDSNYYGLSKVTVNPAQLQEKTVDAMSEDFTVTPDDGYHGLSSVTVEALPNADETYFGGAEFAEEYTIQGESLDNIAKAIQTKKETTAVLTPEQMAVEIDGIVMGDNLPNAEDVSFGNYEVYENGITTWGSTTRTLSVSTSHGYEFTPNENLAVAGFRAYMNNQTSILKLWEESSGNVIATITATSAAAQEWVDFVLDTPVNIFAGKKYAVTREISPVWKTYSSKVTFNPKITFNRNCKGSGSYPSNTDTTTYPLGMVDIIITAPLTESDVTEYKIQTDTMAQIADEVIRITGATSTLTTAQIITALKSVAVQTS